MAKKFQPKIYSHSRLSTFEQCPLKFKFKYIDEIPEVQKTIEAHLGSAVHAALEWLYSQVINKKIPTIDELITHYAVKWEESYSNETLIVKKELTVKDYFNKGVKFLADYYTQHYPFDDNTLEVEKKVMIDLDDEKNYKIQGFIDRLVYNSETEEYEIHDYKTSNHLPNREKIHEDRQLALYSIAIKETFGYNNEVSLVWHYLAHNKKISSKKTNEQLENLKEEILRLIKQIESTKEFSPHKSILCGWCEYKNICTAHGNLPPSEAEVQKKLIENIFSNENSEEIEKELMREKIKEKEEMLDIW